jgi:8-oxo-dGTP pyrophosphatase MutT (NUDIX family)
MEIQEKDGIEVVRFPKACVAVIVYTLDANGVIKEIGVVKEKNPHFQEGFTENVIMGTVEAEDTSLLERAMIELKEEAGVEILDSLKWSFLGEIYTSKISPDPIYMFSVNATGASISSPTGDGTGTEKILSFELLPASEALKKGDSVMLSAFFKLFMQIYQKEIKTN